MADLFGEDDKGGEVLAGDETEGNDDDDDDDALADMEGADQMHQADALLMSLCPHDLSMLCPQVRNVIMIK